MELKLALKVDDLDNVATIFANGIVDGTAITKEEIGLMMTHLNQKGESDEQ